MNYSRQRVQILTALKAHPVHPTADELWHALKAEDPRLSLATVYRNLNQMVQLGLVRKITGLDAKDHFDHTLQPHDHFICTACGCVQDVPWAAAADMRVVANDVLGADAEVREINLKGLCPTCRAALTNHKGE